MLTSHSLLHQVKGPLHGTQPGDSELEDLKAGESTKWGAGGAEKRLLRGNQLGVLMCRLRLQQEDRELDLHKEELPKVRKESGRVGAFGHALALARALTGILGRPSAGEVVGNKKRLEKMEEGGARMGKKEVL